MARARIPDDLTPIPELDRSILPAWISDVGKIEDDDYPEGQLVMVARGRNGETFHCDVRLEHVVFDETFAERYAAPMVNNLGGALFDAEFPGKYNDVFRWQASGRELTDAERAVIARFNELTWKPPATAG